MSDCEINFTGMNAVVRSYVRMGIYNRCKVYGVRNSFEGLAKGDLKVSLYAVQEV